MLSVMDTNAYALQSSSASSPVQPNYASPSRPSLARSSDPVVHPDRGGAGAGGSDRHADASSPGFLSPLQSRHYPVSAATARALDRARVRLFTSASTGAAASSSRAPAARVGAAMGRPTLPRPLPPSSSSSSAAAPMTAPSEDSVEAARMYRDLFRQRCRAVMERDRRRGRQQVVADRRARAMGESVPAGADAAAASESGSEDDSTGGRGGGALAGRVSRKNARDRALLRHGPAASSAWFGRSDDSSALGFSDEVSDFGTANLVGEDDAALTEEDEELLRRIMTAEYRSLLRAQEHSGRVEVGWLDPDEIVWLEDEMRREEAEMGASVGEGIAGDAGKGLTPRRAGARGVYAPSRNVAAAADGAGATGMMTVEQPPDDVLDEDDHLAALWEAHQRGDVDGVMAGDHGQGHGSATSHPNDVDIDDDDDVRWLDDVDLDQVEAQAQVQAQAQAHAETHEMHPAAMTAAVAASHDEEMMDA